MFVFFKELVALCWTIAEFISLTSIQMPCESISNTSISLSLCVCVCQAFQQLDGNII